MNVRKCRMCLQPYEPRQSDQGFCNGVCRSRFRTWFRNFAPKATKWLLTNAKRPVPFGPGDSDWTYWAGGFVHEDHHDDPRVVGLVLELAEAYADEHGLTVDDVVPITSKEITWGEYGEPRPCEWCKTLHTTTRYGTCCSAGCDGKPGRLKYLRAKRQAARATS